MTDIEQYTDRVFSLDNLRNISMPAFCSLALQAYELQKRHCKVYYEYLRLIGKADFQPSSVEEIPFLPIRLFKSCDVLTEISACQSKNPTVFFSSATTGMKPSHHIVSDIKLYERSFEEGFKKFYGESGSYNLLALLPSYMEREGSSLIYMAEKLIADTKEYGAEGGLFLYNHNELLSTLKRLAKTSKRKTILLGVSFALLDFATYVTQEIPDASERKAIFCNTIVMETGGMKKRREELSREHLHKMLEHGFCCKEIHSEYGMCELLSQAYSTNIEGIFSTPPWMKILVRDLQDPFKVYADEDSCLPSGGLNIIDLCNIYSCCFIETEDRGRLLTNTNGMQSLHRPFTVDGRIANAELRGCNMLI